MTYPGVYKARCISVSPEGLATLYVPQLFGDVEVTTSSYIGGPPTPGATGYAAFEGGESSYPVWVSASIATQTTSTAETVFPYVLEHPLKIQNVVDTRAFSVESPYEWSAGQGKVDLFRINTMPNSQGILYMRAGGVGTNTIVPVVRIDDFQAAPILQVFNEGGLWVNDNMRMVIFYGGGYKRGVEMGYLDSTNNEAPALIFGYVPNVVTSVDWNGGTTTIESNRGLWLRWDDSDDTIQSAGTIKPALNNTFDIGAATARIKDFYLQGKIYLPNASLRENNGAPESSVTANPGAITLDYTNGDAYVKKSGTGNTGWRRLTTTDDTSVTPGVRWVSPNGSDSNTGTGPEDGRAFRTIQAAIDSLPDTGTSAGGWVYVLPGTYAPFTADFPNLVIQGLGGAGHSDTDGRGLVRVEVGDAEIGADLGSSLASHKHAGPSIRNLYFVDTSAGGTATAGIRIGRFSNFKIIECTCAEFTSGIGIWVDGEISGGSNVSQYGVIDRCVVGESLIGIQNDNSNYLRVTNCFLEGASTGSPPNLVVASGSKGIYAAAGSVLSMGNAIQIFEIGYQMSAARCKSIGDRYEATTTGVLSVGGAAQIGPGLHFNNYMISGTGTGSAIGLYFSDRDIVHPFRAEEMNHPPVAETSATRTLRLDTDRYQAVINPGSTVSATTTTVVAVLSTDWATFGAGGYHKLRGIRFSVGATAIAASGTDYWTVTMQRGGGSSGAMQSYRTVDSQSGWAAYEEVTIDTTTSGTDWSVRDDDVIRIVLTKTGSPSALSQPVISFRVEPF